jgi:hypothetical protein
MIRIPYGTTHKVHLETSAWKPVTCEKCKCRYAYRVARSGHGESTDIFWLNPQSAKLKAKLRAYKSAEYSLQSAREAYPCPKCGFYTRAMIDLILSDRANRQLRMAGIISILLLPLLLIVAWEIFKLLPTSNEIRYLIYTMPIFLSLIPIIIVMLRRDTYNPNENITFKSRPNFSDDYPVLLREELIQIANEIFRSKGIKIHIPEWPEE